MTKKPTTEKLLNLLDDKYNAMHQDREVHLEGLLHSRLEILSIQVIEVLKCESILKILIMS